MARSNTIFGLVFLVPCLALAQASPVPNDIPYSVSVDHAQISDPNGMLWSADGGVYLNDQAREAEKSALKEVQDQNADLAQKLKASQAETEANRISPEAWAGIAASVVGTIVTAVATAVAAAQKH